ncbi:MAG: acylphosphatase [Opitutales bacterium]|nr:acylphosphatase [Opitutales bacterium]
MSTHVSHREVWYTGRVQGVGFRAQVLGIARGFDVTGSIQNLTDGRVYLHAEGAEKELDAFGAEIVKSLDGHIRHVEERSFAGLRTTQTFSIKR